MLEIKVATNTNYKNKQLEELKLYCNYEKKGNKYIINEVYKEPVLTLKDILKTKNSKYIYLLSNIMLDKLYKNPDKLKQIPLISLLSMLGLVNQNYSIGNKYKKELSQLYDIQLMSIYYFYSNSKTEFKRLIERCLNNLQNRSVLFWHKCIMIVDSRDEENKRVYKADEEMEKLILDAQKETLKYLGLTTMTQLMKDRDKLKDFNKIMALEIGFNYFFAYDINVGEKAIQIEYENIKNDTNEINNMMLNKVIKMFSTDKYKHFEKDYKTLSNMLIDNNYIDCIVDELVEKYEDNFNSYLVESISLDMKYNKQQEEIKNKYIDPYK